jgi:hypothetical protein
VPIIAPDPPTPADPSEPAGQAGVVSKAPAGLGQSFEVVIQDFADLIPYEIDRWAARGITMPSVGDDVLVLRDETGEPWVPVWWPAGGDEPLLAFADKPWIDVRDHGAIGNGGDPAPAATNQTAIQEAIDQSSPGDVIFFGDLFAVDGAIELKEQRHYIGTDEAPWAANSYADNQPRTGIIAAPGFADGEIVRVREKQLTGQAQVQNGGSLRHLTIDGNSRTGAGIDGVLFKGAVQNWRIEDSWVVNCSGHGILSEDNAGRRLQTLAMRRVTASDNGGDGFHFYFAADCNFVECKGNTNLGHGWWLSRCGLNRLVDCTAEWNSQRGYHVLNSWSLLATGCTTDRNNWDGFYFHADTPPEAHRFRPILLNGCLAKRDGRNDNAGGGGYAGIKIKGNGGGTGERVAPMIINGCATNVFLNDDETGVPGPQIGLSVDYVQGLFVDNSTLWGRVTALENTGNSASVRTGLSVTLVTGDPDTPTHNRPIAIKVPGPSDTFLGRIEWNESEFALERSAANVLHLDNAAFRLSGQTGKGYLQLIEQTPVPGSPPGGQGRLYLKFDGGGNLVAVLKRSDGTEVQLSPGTGSWQPVDGELTALADQASAADRLFYFSGSQVGALTDFTSQARSLLAQATAAGQRTVTGAPSAYDLVVSLLLGLGLSLLWAPRAGAAGSTIPDLTGNGRDGTLGSGATRSDALTLLGGGQAIDLNGTTNGRITSAYAAFTNATTRTILALIRREANAVAHCVWSGDGTTPPNMLLSGGSQNVVARPLGNAGTINTWTAAFPGNGVGTLVAHEFNETADTAALYINGALVSSQANTSQYAGAGNFKVGTRRDTNLDGFNGEFGIVAVKEGALTAAEHRSIAVALGLS